MTVPNLPRVRNPRRTRLIVVASLLGVAVTAVMVLLVVRFASQRPDEVNLGRSRFEVGRSDVFAWAIRRDGPILFKDPLTKRPGREIYVQHLGNDEAKGWFALDAYAPSAPRKSGASCSGTAGTGCSSTRAGTTRSPPTAPACGPTPARSTTAAPSSSTFGRRRASSSGPFGEWSALALQALG